MEVDPVINLRKNKYSNGNKPTKDPVDNKKTIFSKLEQMDKKLIITLFIVFAFLSFIIGALIGYGIVGDGNALDILRFDTWVHLFKLVFG